MKFMAEDLAMGLIFFFSTSVSSYGCYFINAPYTPAPTCYSLPEGQTEEAAVTSKSTLSRKSWSVG